MHHQLLIATTNRGKVRELRALLASLPLELVTPADLGLTFEVEETGTTYAENARLKAAAYHAATNLPALADDSGLEVDALAGAPGVYSARYAPLPNPTDQDRRRYLLSQLQGRPRPWPARFRCIVAVAGLEPGEPVLFEGVCEGEIVPEERGSSGFGYDPIFGVLGTAHTMAELGEEQKNRISHRARAVQAALPWLGRFFQPG